MELLDIAIWASVGAVVEAFTGIVHKVLAKLGLRK
jgi:hypothetical protein